MKYKRGRGTACRAHRHGPHRHRERHRTRRRRGREARAQGAPHPGRPADGGRHHGQQGHRGAGGLREPPRGPRGHPGLASRTSSSRASSTPRTRSCSIGGVPVGGTRVVVMAGPCAVESLEQTLTIAKAVKELGAHLLRGGAYKPRTSPYSFQGLGEEGLKILAEAREVDGPPGRDRGPRHVHRRPRRALRGLPADRRAEHAELRAPQARGPVGQAGPPQARDVRDARGIPPRGRVRARRGQPERRPVRARRADVQRLHAQHARPRDRAGGRTAQPSPDPRRSVARHRAAATRSFRCRSRPSRPARTASRSRSTTGPDEALSDGPQALTPELFANLMAKVRPVAAAVGRTL